MLMSPTCCFTIRRNVRSRRGVNLRRKNWSSSHAESLMPSIGTTAAAWTSALLYVSAVHDDMRMRAVARTRREVVPWCCTARRILTGLGLLAWLRTVESLRLYPCGVMDSRACVRVCVYVLLKGRVSQVSHGIQDGKRTGHDVACRTSARVSPPCRCLL